VHCMAWWMVLSKAMVFRRFFVHSFFHGIGLTLLVCLFGGRNGQRGSQTQYPEITVVFMAWLSFCCSAVAVAFTFICEERGSIVCWGIK
jgi:hypothetical protein